MSLDNLFVQYLSSNAVCLQKLQQIMASGDQGGHSLYIDMFNLACFNADVVERLLESPLETLPLLHKAVQTYQRQLQTAENSVKQHVQIRFTDLPPIGDEQVLLKLVPKSRSIGRFVAFDGTVTRTGLMKMYEKCRRYECDKCHNIIWVEFDLSVNDFPKRTVCNGKARDGSICNATQLRQLAPDGDSVEYRDYQEIRVQESVEQLEMGSLPRSITVIVEDELVDMCKPGDQVRIVGTVRRRWHYLNKGERCDLDVFLHANNVIVKNSISSGPTSATGIDYIAEFASHWQEFKDEPLRGRNLIVSQFAPQIYGLDTIKLALFLLIIGGVQKNDGGMSIRGESHMLLVGEPGVAKSQFLKFACRLVSRSVLTTGIGSTTAGLTCSAVKDGGEWHLEAGALVLADGGLCCIDEFGSIRNHEKTSIHEAMEQQTLSVAKAGLVCKLNTRCSILAATNPKGNFDYGQSIEVNLALGSPLLSRFDLIFVLLDRRNAEWDVVVSTHILTSEFENTRSANSYSSWASLEKLKSYVKYCKTFAPILIPESEKVLTSYYQFQRRTDQRNSMRTTIRLLESLIRIAQAHARFMCRKHVFVQDAIIAIYLMESSILCTGILGTRVNIHNPFAVDPDSEYQELGIYVFRLYSCNNIYHLFSII